MPEGIFRRVVRRIAEGDLRAEEQSLERRAEELGAVNVEDLVRGEKALVIGSVDSITITPRAGAPSLEIELYDGTATLRVVFLGRRHVAGLATGHELLVEGRVGHDRDSQPVMFNPRYELSAL